MALIKSCRGKIPEIGKHTWLAENATIIGDVKLGSNCSVWFNAVIRGDVNAIRIGANSNIQDGAVIHCTFEKTKTILGKNVSVGHNAIVHGCMIEDNVLVGMGAIVMDNVHVESNVLIAAGSVVLENTRLISNGIYAGVPAKRVKELLPHQFEEMIEKTAKNYQLYSSWF